MIQLWSSNQLGPKARKSFDAWKRIGYSYGLGVRTRVNGEIGGAGAVGEFGWDGAAGAWTMIDPHNHISAFFGMHVKNYGYTKFSRFMENLDGFTVKNNNVFIDNDD